MGNHQRLWIWVGAVGLAFGFQGSARAAGTVAGTTTYMNSPSSLIGSVPMIPGAMMAMPAPPTFDQIMLANQQMLAMQACFAGQMSTSALSQQCPNAELGDIPDMEPQEACKKFAGPNGFDQNLVMAEYQKIMMAGQGMMCKKGQFGALQAQLNCVQQKQAALMQQVGLMQDAVVQNLQKMQTDVRQIHATEEDRKAQGEQVKNMLEGSAGSPGMLKVQDELNKAVNGAIADQVATAKSGIRKLTADKTALEQMIQTKKMTLTNQCFTSAGTTNLTGGKSYRCIPNGPIVSAAEYVICRYQQNQTLGDKGVIEQDPLINKKAESQAQGLQSLLVAMLGDSKAPPADPNDPKKGPDNTAPITILQVSDFEKYYGDALAAFNGKGLDIKSFVLAMISACYTKANQAVELQRKRPNTDIGGAILNLQEEEQALKKDMGKVIEANSQLYEMGIRELTGQSMPLSGVDTCKNATVDNALKCMTDLQTNLTGLLTGRVANSTMNLMVKGTNQATYIPIKCQGINGCVRVLQNAANNIQTEMQRLETFRKNYVLAANQNMQNFARAMAKQLSPQSYDISQGMQALSSRLASMGVPGLTPKPFQAEQLEPQEPDGLPKAPKNILAFIGGQMNPPLLDMSGDVIPNALNGVAAKTKELDQNLGKAQAYMQKLQALPSACAMKSKNVALQKLQDDIEKMNECSSTYSGCEMLETSQDNLTDLLSSVTEAGMGSNENSFDAGEALKGGLSVCVKTKSKFEAAQRALLEAKKKVQKLNEQDPPNETAIVAAEQLRNDAQTKLDDLQNDVAKGYCSSISNRIQKDVEKIKGSGEGSTFEGGLAF